MKLAPEALRAGVARRFRPDTPQSGLTRRVLPGTPHAAQCDTRRTHAQRDSSVGSVPWTARQPVRTNFLISNGAAILKRFARPPGGGGTARAGDADVFRLSNSATFLGRGRHPHHSRPKQQHRFAQIMRLPDRSRPKQQPCSAQTMRQSDRSRPLSSGRAAAAWKTPPRRHHSPHPSLI